MGPEMKRTDYTAHNISSVPMLCTAIDMGVGVMLNFRPRQSIGAENNREFNQCVVNHMALASEWRKKGKRFKTPALSRVDVLGAELRAGEYVQAQRCFDHIGFLGPFANMGFGRPFTMP